MNNNNLFNKNFAIMSVGQFISLFGNSLQRFALSLLILDLTGSAAIFSIILAITFIPQILLAPFGGAIADRVSKKKIMVCLDVFSGLLLTIFLLYYISQSTISVVAIGILMCVLAVIQSIYDPSVRAAIPAVTSQDNLTSANSVVSVVSSLSSLSGPVAAGFLYGIYGIKVIFVINIISFLCSATMELFLYIPHTPAAITGPALHTFVTDIKDTFGYLIHEKPLILQIILVSCSFNLFLTPIYTVGVPFMEKIIFGVSDQLYGISEGLIGAGMITGALLTSIISKKFPFQKLHYYFYTITALVVGMGACAVPVILNTDGISIASYTLFTCLGFTFALILAIINILCMTFMQLEIPMELMGKSMALITAMSTALMPVGQIIFGGLYDVFAGSTWIIYLIVGTFCIIATLTTYRLIRNAISSGLMPK